MPARPPLGSSPWALAGGDCWVRSLFTGFVVFVFPSRWLPDRRSPPSTSPSQTLTSPPPLPFLNPLLHTLPVPHPYPTRPDPTRPDPTRPDPTLPDPTRPYPIRPDPTRPAIFQSFLTRPDPTRENNNMTPPNPTLDIFFVLTRRGSGLHPTRENPAEKGLPVQVAMTIHPSNQVIKTRHLYLSGALGF